MRRAFAIFLVICFIAFSLDGRFVFFPLADVSKQQMAIEPTQTISAPIDFDLKRLN